ncbi:sialate O-acetylesterase [Anaerosporobacter faecicola]|uniref:sialate O-acetylesterase n=1 Tax=Anaerosporobacter faecicola TaxID=2718714 RepID=UPI00143B4F67|nr:sialate O-acetylesterase [Anaerosporobacter faecicola]
MINQTKSQSLKTAAVFRDHMVLQRDKNLLIWGTGKEGDVVTVTLQEHSASQIIKNGTWSLELPPMPAGGPYTMKITTKEESLSYSDIMLGEVWLAGGQSNMELQLINSKNGKDVVANVDPALSSKIRFYNVPQQSYFSEDFVTTEENACWELCTPETCGNWSAVAYYFEKNIATTLDVTVGIIGCNWGGTSASAWTSRTFLEKDVDTKTYLDDYEEAYHKYEDYNAYCKAVDEYDAWYAVWQKKIDELYAADPNISWNKAQEIAGQNRWPGPIGPKSFYRPSGLYETMLSRVCPYTLRGFLYYQGEEDDKKATIYGKLLQTLIKQWRHDWNDDRLPFLLVQLPMFINCDDVDQKNWPIIRENQMLTHQTMKNTGIAVILDLGEFNNIHPLEKEEVGRRLALQAFYHVYGLEVSAYGPIYKSRILHEDSIELLFDHATEGFTVKGDSIEGFEIAGEDKQYVKGTASIIGSRIFVSASKVKSPRYIRYNWTNYGPVTLYGKNNIPVAGFRTDYEA